MDIELAQALEEVADAKEIIKQLLDCLKQDTNDPETNYYVCQYMDKAEQFLEGLKVNPDDRFEVTEKGKEYLSSH